LKILVVAGNYPDGTDVVNIFIKEQVEALKSNYPQLQVDIFNISSSRSKKFYISRRKEFREHILTNKYDIIHYHYGLSAVIGLFQKLTGKQIITFHGSDINDIKLHKLISRIAAKKFDYSIFVNEEMAKKIKSRAYSVIPCGVNTDMFKPLNKEECRNKLGLNMNKKYILFPSNKKYKLKNYNFIERAVLNIKSTNVEILELINYERNLVPFLFNSVDVVVLTSLNEGSPQAIKEAAFCQIPIVSLDVGDVRKIIKGSTNSHIVERNEKLFGEAIDKALKSNVNTGFTNLHEYDNKIISSKLFDVYMRVLEN
jgi:glycosyltransferase involved in cell wall biosynthesis